MTARVQVVVEAKDATSGVFRAITSQLGDFGNLVDDLTAKKIKWGDVGQHAAQMVINGIKDTIKVTTEYAADVRDLALASGQGAEASSRMLQVLDDYQLTADDAATATRALTKEGLAPTIDTIAKLSGQYNSLNSAQEKNEFLQKNLGRASKEWLNLMSQGPDAIRQMNNAVSESLILTDENVKAAEEYRLALDEWNDSVMKLKVAIGNELLPVLTNLMNTDLDKKLIEGAEATGIAGAALDELSKRHLPEIYEATVEARDGFVGLNASMDATIPTEQELAATAKIMNDENLNFVGVLGQVSGALEQYNEGVAAADVALADGSLTVDEHAAKVEALGAQYKSTTSEIVLSLYQMKLTADKTFDDTDLTKYLLAAEKLGVISEKDRQATVALFKEVDTLEASFETAKGPMLHVSERAEDGAENFGMMADASAELGEALRKETAAGAAAATSALNSIPTDINVDINIRTHGGIPSFLGGGGGMGHTYCFVAGTPVTLSDGTRKPIEQLMIGDEVRSYNIERREFVTGKVSNVMSRKADEYLNIDGIQVTDEHPFYVASRGEWVKAKDIKRNDFLLRDYGGMKVINFVFCVSEPATVYNLTVDGEHNYFAGGVLVHNKSTEELEGAGATQQGGEVFAGVPTWVGEAGKERFIPSQNGRILGHAESLHAATVGGMGMSGNNYFYGPVTIAADSGAGGDVMSIR